MARRGAVDAAEHLAVIEALVGAGRAARDDRPRRAA
jgi:hypothetical protein